MGGSNEFSSSGFAGRRGDRRKNQRRLRLQFGLEHRTMEAIDRGVAVTESERYLAQLADATFLDLWSYPNTFTDRGRDHLLCAAALLDRAGTTHGDAHPPCDRDPRYLSCHDRAALFALDHRRARRARRAGGRAALAGGSLTGANPFEQPNWPRSPLGHIIAARRAASSAHRALAAALQCDPRNAPRRCHPNKLQPVPPGRADCPR